MDLVQWLRDQLDEDERIARAARGHGEGRWRHDSSYPNGYVYDEGVQPVVYDESAPSPEEAEHIAAHDPARVLRETDAKRKLLDEHKLDGWTCATCANPEDFDEDGDGNRTWSRRGKDFPCPTLRLLALPYADQPGYRSEWAP